MWQNNHRTPTPIRSRQGSLPHRENSGANRAYLHDALTRDQAIADHPQGKALLDALRAGDIIITAKLDRTFRSALERFGRAGEEGTRREPAHDRLGGDVTGNGISKLVFTILSAVAEAERDRIRERISTVKSDQRKRGRYLGGSVPFGFRLGDDASLEPDEAQQKAISKARKMRSEGVKLRIIQETVEHEFGVRLAISTLHGIVAD